MDKDLTSVVQEVESRPDGFLQRIFESEMQFRLKQISFQLSQERALEGDERSIAQDIYSKIQRSGGCEAEKEAGGTWEQR